MAPTLDAASVCRICGAAMRLDRELIRAAEAGMDPGHVPPLVLTCLNSHSQRFWPMEILRRLAPVVRRCVVCGLELRAGAGTAGKTCSSEHQRFVIIKRNEAQAAHARAHKMWRRGAAFVPFRFMVEAQPWYRGAVTAFQPVPRPQWPLFVEIPAAWLEGFRVAYAPIEREPDPPITAVVDGPLYVPTRRYARRLRTPA